MVNQSSEMAAGKKIIGAWRIEGGDYPLVNEYRSDGTAVQYVGDRGGKPMPFRVEGDLLIVSVKQPDGTIFEDKTRFSISDDTLIFFDSPDGKRVFRRIDSPTRPYH
jgi:hypothetical protein